MAKTMNIKVPVMIHRAILGVDGTFHRYPDRDLLVSSRPGAPVQVIIADNTDSQSDSLTNSAKTISTGIRVKADLRNRRC